LSLLESLDHSVPPACSAEGWPTAGLVRFSQPVTGLLR
jgi:hypothetical protein